MRQRTIRDRDETGANQSTAPKSGIALGAEAAEHERQFREILEFCPAALLVVDEDGRLLFHNARLREILGYTKEELDFCDTRMHWQDLDQRARIIKQLQDKGGQILNEKVTWRTKKRHPRPPPYVIRPGGLPRRPCQLRRR